MELLNSLTLADLYLRYGDRLNSAHLSYSPASVRVRILIPEGLRARVVGARAYTVVVRDEGDQIITACTCPYHLHNVGDCKHIIATLLAWVQERPTFKPTPEWCRLLTHKSRDEMLAILLDMCESHPQLLEEYGLVELARQAGQAAGQAAGQPGEERQNGVGPDGQPKAQGEADEAQA